MVEQRNRVVRLLEEAIPELPPETLEEAYRKVITAVGNNRVSDIGKYLDELEQTCPRCVELLTTPLNNLPPGITKEVLAGKTAMVFMRQTAQKALVRK